MGTVLLGEKTEQQTAADEPTTATREEMKRRFTQAKTLISVQQMLSKLSLQCFRKCVTQPQSTLDGSERACITLCMDRYVDSFNLVARAYGRRMQRELKKGIDAQQPVDV